MSLGDPPFPWNFGQWHRHCSCCTRCHTCPPSFTYTIAPISALPGPLVIPSIWVVPYEDADPPTIVRSDS